MPGHSHEQFIEREIAARINDGTCIVVNDQELIGLYRLAIFFDEVGEHQASVILVAVKFQGHIYVAVQ